ncbi:hypothetical protein M422DRAFT_43596 [Sphaerobolus stellatus SS14]|nr:hypothetical protein M422DRAFT_43596 [Sphaerobolus stellatus SS14]
MSSRQPKCSENSCSLIMIVIKLEELVTPHQDSKCWEVILAFYAPDLMENTNWVGGANMETPTHPKKNDESDFSEADCESDQFPPDEIGDRQIHYYTCPTEGPWSVCANWFEMTGGNWML